MPSVSDIAIIGTGSLARSICYTLPLISERALKITVIGRSLGAAKEVATVGNVRSQLVNSKVFFTPREIDWENKQSLNEALIGIQAKIILLASSLQSPWEFSNTHSKWSTLVRQGGFGLTLPLQAYLAMKIGFLFKEYGFQGLFINACYPDGVNPLLKGLGVNITCGIGNISIIHSFLRTNMKLKDEDKLEILAHHFHVGTSLNQLPNDQCIAWLNGKPISKEDLSHLSIADVQGSALNNITGLTAAQMLLAFLDTRTVNCHSPGPYGLPGGYPITVGNMRVDLNLPKDISLEQAIAKNQHWSLLDGVTIENKKVNFNSHATQLLKEHNFKYYEGFNIEEISNACEEMLKLRQELRKL